VQDIIRYSAVQRKLHWLVVALVGLQYLLQSPMKTAMDGLDKGATLSAIDFLVTTVHTWGGMAIGIIMVYRLMLRRQRPVPVGAGTLTGWSKRLAAGLHWAFYVLLLFMASTGVLHYYLEWQTAAQWHHWGKWLLLCLIVFHGLAALLHLVIKKDAVMRQMWGSRPPH